MSDASATATAPERDPGLNALRGALVADAAGCRRIPSVAVDAIDPTGAGDTFNGVLAAGLAAGLDIDHAVKRATRAGACATLAFGTIAAIPSAAQLATFIENHP